MFNFTDKKTDNKEVHEKSDENRNKTENNSKRCISDDDDDMILSQALDDLERSQVPLPEPKMPKLAQKLPKRPLIKLGRFAFTAPKNQSKENVVQLPPPSNSSTIISKGTVDESLNQNKVPNVSQPVRNRIFCTPSDDENSQNEASRPKLSAKTLNILNSFKANKTLKTDEVLQQPNVTEAKKPDESHSQNDSAYETMAIDASLPSTAASCIKTGKTPALFPSSGQTENEVDDDLSFLDTLEF